MRYGTNLKRVNELMMIANERASNKERVDITFESSSSILLPTKAFRIKSQTLKDFLADDIRRKVVMGAFGSGKSTACCFAILARTCLLLPCSDGVRRARWLIVRSEHTKLVTTFLKTWRDWFGGWGSFIEKERPVHTILHKFYDKKGGNHVELELIMMGLESQNDLSKLDSLELTGCYINEIREIPKAVYDRIDSRIGRYPHAFDYDEETKKVLETKSFAYLIADTNAPEIHHWLPEMEAEVAKNEQYQKDTKFYHQPPNILQDDKGKWYVNELGDNLENGMRAYFQALADSLMSDSYKKVYGQGLYGLVKIGKPVYSNYNDELHSVETIEIDRNNEILLAWDYGSVCPACLVCQLVNGQLRAINEFIGTNTLIDDLVKLFVLPYIKQFANGLQVKSIGDPANTMYQATTLCALGIPTYPARTNNPAMRLLAVNSFLSGIYQAKPTFILSRIGCPKLRQGFMGHYSFEKVMIVGQEQLKEVPLKNHPYSDIHDCLQYAALAYNFVKDNFDDSAKKDGDIMNLVGSTSKMPMYY